MAPFPASFNFFYGVFILIALEEKLQQLLE